MRGREICRDIMRGKNLRGRGICRDIMRGETFFEGKATSMKTGCLPRLSNVAAAVSVGLLIIMTMMTMAMMGIMILVMSIKNEDRIRPPLVSRMMDMGM